MIMYVWRILLQNCIRCIMTQLFVIFAYTLSITKILFCTLYFDFTYSLIYKLIVSLKLNECRQCIQCLRSKDQIWRAHNTLQPTMWQCDIIESKSINTTKQGTRPVSVSRHQTVAENCWNIAIACLCCSCSSMLPTACPIGTEYSWWFPINFLMEVSATQFR